MAKINLVIVLSQYSFTVTKDLMVCQRRSPQTLAHRTCVRGRCGVHYQCLFNPGLSGEGNNLQKDPCAEDTLIIPGVPSSRTISFRGAVTPRRHAVAAAFCATPSVGSVGRNVEKARPLPQLLLLVVVGGDVAASAARRRARSRVR